MHICFLTREYPKTGYPHGGFGTFVQTMAQELTKRGHKVTVIGLNYENKYEVVNEVEADIYRLKPSKVRGLSLILNWWKINKCIRAIHEKSPIDIVEASELGLAFVQKISSIRYVIRLHGGHHFFAESEKRGINFWKGFQEKFSFRKADAFIAVSEFVKIHTQKYLSYHGKDIEIINYPVDFTLFRPSEFPKIAHRRIVFAGTICEKKGVRELIQAFKLVKVAFEEAQLYLYGRDWFYSDGRSYIQQLQKDFSADDLNQIHFMGSVSHSDLPLIYESAEICVFPSHMETQGLVVPEAMAMEKVVVFSAIGPGPETIINDETGYLVNPYKPSEIANAIMTCFADPEKSRVLGVRAREAALIKFNPEIIFKKNIDFYKTVLK